MRTPVVAGNWKMHGDLALTGALVAAAASAARGAAGVEVLVLPPAVLIPAAAAAAQGRLAVGGQDLSRHRQGAYTGELSGAMLVEAGCSHVLVGHSERRQYHGEDDALVAAKFQAAQAAGLVPVLCVGETLDERDAGRTGEVVTRQLGAVLAAAGVGALAGALLAYEPVWAIGTGRTASPEQAQQVHALLRSEVERQDARIAAALRILYGGSVKPDNAAGLFGQDDIDGGLVGGASLVAEDFSAIIAAAAGRTKP
ncbi:MAG: triose-phosphate isomerase [Xanthomonadales bacterium]|nr:triose-phosphate isomerase [Xanthomonadales bacterium]